MKKLIKMSFALSLAALAANCGLQKDDGQSASPATDGGVTTPAPDGGTDVLPAPFRSPAACIFDFSADYVSGATCGEVRGTLPGMSWTQGVQIANPDGDGYLGMAYTVTAGTYELSYLGWQNCATRDPKDAWAQYGDQDQLLKMTPDSRAFINCNWWNATTAQVIAGVNPSCDIRITVDNACKVLPAGNMANFVAQH